MKHKDIQGLRYMGYGYKKIASILGLPVNSVKSYCRRNPIDKEHKHCVNCGIVIEMTPKKKEKKYCSDKCRLAWWNSHPNLVKRKTIYNYTCKHCGMHFQSYNKTRKYCSRDCYNAVQRKEASKNG